MTKVRYEQEVVLTYDIGENNSLEYRIRPNKVDVTAEARTKKSDMPALLPGDYYGTQVKFTIENEVIARIKAIQEIMRDNALDILEEVERKGHENGTD